MAGRIMGGLMSAAEAFPSKLIDERSAEIKLTNCIDWCIGSKIGIK